jgi:hypothetical protein
MINKQILKETKERIIAQNLILKINSDNPCSTEKYDRKKRSKNQIIDEYIENHYDRIAEYQNDYNLANKAIDNPILITSGNNSNLMGYNRIVTSEKDLELSINEMQEELQNQNKSRTKNSNKNDDLCYKIQTRLLAYQNAIQFSNKSIFKF